MLIALAIGLIGLAPTAQSAIIVDAVYDTSTSADAYAADILLGDLLSTATVDSSAGTWGGDGIAGLTDGLHGAPYAGWVNPSIGDAVVTWDLGLGDNGAGWDLTLIQSISAFGNNALANQEFILEYETVAGGGFATLGTFGPVDTSAAGGLETSTKITITDDSGVVASGVRYLRFSGRPTGAVNPGYRELDVDGVSTIPEPATAGLLGMSLVSLFLMRRRVRG